MEQGGWILPRPESGRGKSNEITAIPKVLEAIEIKGQVVTIDAMGTQTAIVETIRKRCADYVPAVKGNQGNLETHPEMVFKYAEADRNTRPKMSLKRKRFNISFAPAQFIEELMQIKKTISSVWVGMTIHAFVVAGMVLSLAFCFLFC